MLLGGGALGAHALGDGGDGLDLAASSSAGLSTVSVALTNGIRLAASPSASATTSASLTTSVRLSSAISASASQSAVLTTGVNLLATPTATATPGTINLAVAAILAASPSATASGSVSLTNSIRLAASTSASLTSAFAILNWPNVVGNVSALAITSLSTDIRLGGSLNATAVGAVDLQVPITASSVAGLLTSNVNLSTGIRLAATGNMSASQFTSIVTGITLAATPSATIVAADAPLTAAILLAATSEITAQAAPNLASGINLAGMLAGTALGSVQMTNAIRLAVVANANAGSNTSIVVPVELAVDDFSRVNGSVFLRDSVTPLYASARFATAIASSYLRTPVAGTADLLAARIAAKPSYQLIRATRI